MFLLEKIKSFLEELNERMILYWSHEGELLFKHHFSQIDLLEHIKDQAYLQSIVHKL